MNRWTDSLPEPDGAEPCSWLYFAVAALNEALLDQALRPEGHPDNTMLTSVRSAAADVRAWRMSLPDQGKRVASWENRHMSDRELLYTAMHQLLYADAGVAGGAGQAHCLRWTESYLRVLGLRIMDRMGA